MTRGRLPTPYQSDVSLVGAAAVITIPVATIRAGIRLFRVGGWYDGDPAGGETLSVRGGGFNFEWPVTSGGTGWIDIGHPAMGAESDKSSDIVVTLTALVGQRGYLNLDGEIY